MQIKKLYVQNLFDAFTHTINFKINEGITLILGQNGLGKTMILKIIKAIFNKDFAFLSNIQYDIIQLTFDNNIVWEIIPGEDRTVKLILKEDGENVTSSKTCSPSDVGGKTVSRQLLRKVFFQLNRAFPDKYQQLDEHVFYDRDEDIVLTIEEVIHKHRNDLSSSVLSRVEKTILPDWYNDVISSKPVFLIETQRLIRINQEKKRQRFGVPEDNKFSSMVVNNYSDELSYKVKMVLSNSSELAAKLDRTYPNRLMARLKNTSNISQDVLNRKLENLENKRLRLESVGLLDLKEEQLDFIKEQDERTREVLLVYVEDSEKKLDVYDDLASKIELFLKIINSRFLKKKLSVKKEKGFNFSATASGKNIPLNTLSSGEQHLLVLYYQLLFKIKKGSLLLLDEPEISLHISWQKKIISDLKEILKINPVHVVIATHSPAVIGENWDLTVELNAD